MTSKLKLSIITVCYNCELTIEETIKSVIFQKTDEIEYIIIDGKSTDGTLQIINKYADKIDTIVSEIDNGISDAFNKGIKIASGNYIGLINSDDQYLPWALKKFLNEVHTETDIFFGNGIRMYPDKKCKRYMADPNPEQLHKSMSFVHPSTFVRREAYKKFGLFSTDFECVMDRELLLRMLNCGAKFQYSKSFYSVYNMGGLSDRNYLKKVIPESYRIDIADGMPKIKARKNYWKNILIFYLLKLRDFIKFDDRKRFFYEQILNEVSDI